MKYRVYGLVLDTQEPLAELDPIDAAATGADVHVFTESQDAWPNSQPSDDDAWPTVHVDSAGYLLNFGDEAAFRIAADGRTIRCFPAASPASTLNHFLLDHVLPRALDLFGKNPLHATAVATNTGVLAFFGKTGTGKSTIAAALGRFGASLISDDCLVLHRDAEAIVATPSYAGLRLYDDVREALFPDASSKQVAHYSTKQRLATVIPLAREPQPLRAMFALERVPELERPVIEPLGPADAIMTLTSSAFRLGIERKHQHPRQLSFFADVARRVPIRRCMFGDDLSNVGVLAEAILEDAATSAR